MKTKILMFAALSLLVVSFAMLAQEAIERVHYQRWMGIENIVPFDGTTVTNTGHLRVVGNASATGSVSAASGAFTGALSASNATFTGVINLPGGGVLQTDDSGTNLLFIANSITNQLNQ
jgi:hypothetical protein